MARKRKTDKKVTSYASASSAHTLDTQSRPSHIQVDKKKARTYRTLAILFWVAAIAFEVVAILELGKNPINTTWLISYIVLDLIFLVCGSLFWKKANRCNPASRKNKIAFFLQNQLGLIVSIIAFLPLIILIFKNDKLDSKQKGVVATVAVAALLIAGLTGIDFKPPSQEQYAEETQQVMDLNNGNNLVYWTKSGKSYHLFEDCSYINTDRTTEIFEGTVVQAKTLKKISDLCDRCSFKSTKKQ